MTRVVMGTAERRLQTIPNYTLGLSTLHFREDNVGEQGDAKHLLTRMVLGACHFTYPFMQNIETAKRCIDTYACTIQTTSTHVSTNARVYV